MKRIITAVFATASALVLLFTYKTSLEVVTPEAADTSAATTSSANSGTDASSGADASTGSGSAASSSPDASSGSGSDASSASGSSSSTDAGTGTDSSTDTGSDSSTDSGTGTTTSTSGLVDGTYTGTAVNTRYGAVQVAVTVSGGVITDVQVPQYPVRDRKDQQINSVAVPELVQETLSAQSADIQMISGATYTSEGYVQSLQSALDQAAS